MKNDKGTKGTMQMQAELYRCGRNAGDAEGTLETLKEHRI